MRRTTILLLFAVMALTGCASAQAPSGAATPAPVTVVPETGLLSYSELPENTFAIEIMPDADEHICEIILDYYGGPNKNHLGQLVFEPAAGSCFTREETFWRGFTTDDETLLENFTLSFQFTDEDGTQMAADNDYVIDADYGVNYFLKIIGSHDEGYSIAEK